MKIKETRNEALLVQKIIGGDKHAFGILIGPYCIETRWYIATFLRDDPLSVDDMLQETLLKFYLAINKGQYIHKNNTKKYLFSTAHNTCIDHIKRSKTFDRHLPASFSDESIWYLVRNITSLQYSTQEMVDISLLRKRVIEGICRLPEEQRVVVQFDLFEGFTNQQIADSTGITLNTVKTRIRAAKAQLREFLKEYK